MDAPPSALREVSVDGAGVRVVVIATDGEHALEMWVPFLEGFGAICKVRAGEPITKPIKEDWIKNSGDFPKA